MRFVRILLVIIAVVCFGVALSYPVRYFLAQKSNDSNMEQLSQMRSKVREDALETTLPADEPAPSGPSESKADSSPPAQTGEPVAADIADSSPAGESEPEEQLPRFPAKPTLPPDAEGAGPPAAEAVPESVGTSTDAPEATAEAVTQGAGTSTTVPEAQADATSEAAPPAGSDAEPPPDEPTAKPVATPTPEPTPTPDPYYWDLARYMDATPTPTPKPTPTPIATPTPVPTPTPDRSIRTGPLPYALKDKVTLDESAILPELRDIYALNNDLVGWVTIPGTVIDYPVVQNEDSEFYLSHDFYGEENVNGQIILDPLCDPYTPSYNLILSGHHMKNGTMFGNLPEYRTKGYWEKHRFLEFDSLMERKLYVIFAAFYSADYDEDEEGFRYNANLEYKQDVRQWLAEVEENQLYDTGVETEFGDEFITLTTCNRARHRNGRFVVVCRKIREGETFE